MFTSHFYEDKIDDVAVSYLVFVIITHFGFCVKRISIKNVLGYHLRNDFEFQDKAA